MSLLNTNLPTKATRSSFNLKNLRPKIDFSERIPPLSDYPNGFTVEELSPDGTETLLLFSLLGNMMPHRPFIIGGGQRIQKDYYPGNNEPVMQVLGATEHDVTIMGDLKDTKFPRNQYGLSERVMDLIQGVRVRANLCRFTLGGWRRYGFIQMAEFEQNRITRIKYRITLSIIGLSPPTNIKFAETTKRVPFGQAQKLADDLRQVQQDLQNVNNLGLPDRSIADIFNEATNQLASQVNAITDYIDAAFAFADNIRRSINRAISLVKRVQRQVRRYQRTLRNIGSGGFIVPIPVRVQLDLHRQLTSSITNSARIQSTLDSLRNQFVELQGDSPESRHLVVSGDTLPKISVRYYGTPDNWREIAGFNNLPVGQVPVPGTRLDIPKL